MKKTFLFLALASIAITSCRKDDDQIVPEVSIETQNNYDNESAQKFLQTHAFDAKGNLKDYVATDTTQVKLASLSPITLPSGVIYVVRPNAQPTPGKDIGSTDILRLMTTTVTYVATNTDNVVAYTSPYVFRNTIAGSGIPEVDPAYYNVKQSVLDNATLDLAKQRSFYEIEGFKEALQKFKAYDIPDESNYNLQGVIIVPSRAAFARDAHFNYSGISFKDRSFVFNFQVYKTTPR
ncbi:hypothetical protein Q73A0000_16235 [Kaistella flava (ex Peng et al. 2021)]|uniref:Uncharacterized protein n=1 Tax=Kaistella flava (ex Peng et al. 2021) TaxID=2038776 RepID=A0A7M2YCF3_9FLAO|nr:hypothetical protein [Kaistella flava (ex Peng et al. 2021)]QOW11801.1 hypothetical protein Q73A0000_16235 [Kaistella flava (ex Peng et al. 2021)]